jgi:Domain of unknown function (DUF4062)
MEMSDRELLIDLTSPLPTPTIEDVRRWAAGKTVFISSTMLDLQPERKRVADVVNALGVTPRFFEGFSSPADPANIYVPEVNRGDVYVLILGERYGGVIESDPERRSATHIEYDAAIKAYKPILVYRKDLPDDAREAKLLSWMRQLDNQHTVNRFHDLDMLENAIREGINGIAASQSLEWVKLGSAVFPASKHTRSGNTVEIHTTTQDARIVAHLKSLDRPNQSQLLVVGEAVFSVVQVSVSEESRGRYQRDFVVTVQTRPLENKLHVYAQMAVNNRPPSEWVTHLLRAKLFGEPMPKDDIFGRHERDLQMQDDYLPKLYATLKSRNLADSLFPAIAHLYLTESLLCGFERDSGLTKNIYRLEITPPQRGKARVSISYAMVDGSMGNQGSGVPVNIEGEIELEDQRERAIPDWR